MVSFKGIPKRQISNTGLGHSLPIAPASQMRGAPQQGKPPLLLRHGDQDLISSQITPVQIALQKPTSRMEESPFGEKTRLFRAGCFGKCPTSKRGLVHGSADSKRAEMQHKSTSHVGSFVFVAVTYPQRSFAICFHPAPGNSQGFPVAEPNIRDCFFWVY